MRHLFFALAAASLVGAGCVPSPSPSVSSPVPSSSTLEERVVKTSSVEGLYVVPKERSGRLPGIVVIHEWWGLNDQIKDEARKLAGEGYAVFAIDLYDGEVAADATRAGQLAGSVRQNPDAALAKMKAALDYLAAQPEVASDTLASLGWCFGGGMSAILGTSGDPRLKATAIYYGTPITDAVKLAKMKQPVLGVWGKEDQSIPVANAEAFETSLKKQNTPVEFYYYDGAGHAFANPTRSDSYRPEATADAWVKTLDFLSRNLSR
jgi:carboxymethylenebutenolidase